MNDYYSRRRFFFLCKNDDGKSEISKMERGERERERKNNLEYFYRAMKHRECLLSQYVYAVCCIYFYELTVRDNIAIV